MDYAAIAERMKPSMRAALLKIAGRSPRPETIDALAALGLVRLARRAAPVLTSHGGAVLRELNKAVDKPARKAHLSGTVLPERSDGPQT